MAIITRAEKGSALSHAELDNNFIELNTLPNGKVFISSQTVGVKLNQADPQWGWHDLTGSLFIHPGSGTPAISAIYKGGIRAYQFIAEGQEAFIDFHMPHDYAMGTHMHIHVHWSHSSNIITSGSTTWVFEVMYAKGHGQSAFSDPILIPVIQNASLTPYMHQVAETILSSTGGSALTIDTGILEVDGVFQCRLYLDSNDIITSNASEVHPYVHFVDIHYQSTGLPTKNRAPDFWL